MGSALDGDLMTWKVNAKTKGRLKIPPLGNIRGNYVAGVYPVPVTRSVRDTFAILGINARRGRRVVYLSRVEKLVIMRLWLAARKTAIGAPASAVRTLRAAMEIVAKRMTRALQDHIRKGRGPRGPFTPLKPKSQKQKDSDVGPGKPPMYRTGELLRSMRAATKFKG